MWNSWLMFSVLVSVAAFSGFSGGYMFGRIEQALPSGWGKYFNAASVVMLAQDVLTNTACLVLIQVWGISLSPIGGPFYVTLFFFVVVFLSPAGGFLMAQR